MIDKIAPYWKAVVGFVAPGATILISSVLASSAGGETITAAEWVTAACTCVVTSAAVYAVKNEPYEGDGI
jgi:hypothetical protein